MVTAAAAAAAEETVLVESSSASSSPSPSPSASTTPQPLVVQLCKHWLKSKSCLYHNKGLCKFSHPENYEIPKPGETKKQQSRRQSQRSQSQSQNNNPNRHRSAGGRLQTRNDARVAQLRCFIATTINNMNSNGNGNGNRNGNSNILEQWNVLDVAGGKGELAFQLLNLNNVQSCYVVDPRPLKLDRFQRRLQKGYYHRSSTIIQTDIIRNQQDIERNVDHLYCFFSNELWIDEDDDKDKDNSNIKEEEDDGDENKDQQDNKEEQKEEEGQSRKIEFDKNIYKAKGWIWPPVGDDNNEHDSYCKGCDSSSSRTTTTTTKKKKNKRENDDATKTDTTEAKLWKSNENDSKANDAITTDEKEIEIVTTTAPTTSNNNDDNNKNNYNNTQHQQQHVQSSIPTFQYAVDVVSKCNLIVGMHPDQAVDAIIDAALYKNISFFVVPCCTYSREFPNRRIPLITTANTTTDDNNENEDENEKDNNENGKTHQQQKTATKLVTTYDELLQYLENKSSDIKRHVLPFEGRNVCLYRVVI